MDNDTLPHNGQTADPGSSANGKPANPKQSQQNTPRMFSQNTDSAHLLVNSFNAQQAKLPASSLGRLAVHGRPSSNQINTVSTESSILEKSDNNTLPNKARSSYVRHKLTYIIAALAFVILLSGGLTLALTGKPTTPAKPLISKDSTNDKKTAQSKKSTIPSNIKKSTPASTAQNNTDTSQKSVASTLPPSIPNTNTNNAPTSPYVGSLPSTVPDYNFGGNNYYYAGDRQFVTASGESVSLSQDQPQVAQSAGTENHSLIEMSAESSDGKQIVEVGWVVDPKLNGDSLPHLFVFYWVNGQPSSCYNTCGFVSTSSSVAPGNALSVNTTGDYSIAYSNNGWYISYNGTQVGYFPESLWGGSFTQLGFTEIFGEVEISSASTTQCVQMGNGIAGTSTGSATISNFSLIGSSSAPALSPYATASSPYSYGFASAVGVNIGGAGAC